MAGQAPLLDKALTEEQVAVESGERVRYVKMFGLLIFVIGQGLGWCSYLVTLQVPGQKDIYDRKFEFIHEYQLGYVFLAWFLLHLTRAYLTLNANGARKPTGLDRPDQHIYESSDGTQVRMVGSGVEGRFNRSQRAAYNMDEGLPLFCTGVLLNASVFGPLALLPLLCAMFGRISFANKYKQALAMRLAGFRPSIISEHWSLGLVCVCVVKGIGGSLIPI